MIEANASSISSPSDGLHFTRLGVLAGFGTSSRCLDRAFDALHHLVGSLGADQILAVDCSDFSELSSFGKKPFQELFAEKSHPTVLLKNCDLDFSRDFKGFASHFTQPSPVEYDEVSCIPAAVRDAWNLTKKKVDYVIPAPESEDQVNKKTLVGALELESTYLRTCVVQSAKEILIDEAKTRLRSTPLRSNYYFDANEMLGHSDRFIWVISRLASDFQTLVALISSQCEGQGLQKLPRLLACTRNGTAIASALQAYLTPIHYDKLRLDVVDRFGPMQRMVEEYDGGQVGDEDGHQWYVYIGDFTIAGTELKIAEAHSYYRGIPLLAGIVMGSVFQMLSPADLKHFPGDALKANKVMRNRFSVFPMISLQTLSLNKKLKYQFP